MLRDRAWIANHIPHQGTMCLLDGVLDWNSDRARCVSGAHRSAGNPLRSRGRLAAACGIEFAAQAIAVHGALLAPGLHLERRVGYLASIRGVELHVGRLDDIADDLIASVERLAADDSTVLYRFALSAGGRPLVGGRVTIVLNPNALAAIPGPPPP